MLWNLCKRICETGQLRSEKLKSVFIAIPKTSNALECENHRTTSSIVDFLKLLLKIILRRIRRKLFPKSQSANTLYSLTNAQGMLFVLCALCEQSIEHQQDVFLCFIDDYHKVFDKVRHSQLVTMLKRIDINYNGIRIIHNLSYDQKAAVKLTKGGLTGWTNIKRSVEKGCVMSPELFNLYREFILKRTEGGWGGNASKW